jgi:hypothetical protein
LRGLFRASIHLGKGKAMQTCEYEYTDTFAGEANYCWMKRGSVSVPDLTRYGYDGSHGYAKANKRQQAVIVRRVKAALGISRIKHVTETWGDQIKVTPRNSGTVIFINYRD